MFDCWKRDRREIYVVANKVGLRYIISIDILLFHVSEYFELLLMLLRQWGK